MAIPKLIRYIRTPSLRPCVKIRDSQYSCRSVQRRSRSRFYPAEADGSGRKERVLRSKAALLLALVLCVMPALAQRQSADTISKDMEERADALRSQKDYIAAANLYRGAL